MLKRINLVAPAALPSQEVLYKSAELVENLGYTPIIDPSLELRISARNNAPVHRCAELINACNDDSDVIWCIKGGYGAIQLLSQHLKNNISSINRKLFIGFSDITLLHLFINKYWKCRTIHGEMLERIVSAEIDILSGNLTRLVDIIENPGVPYMLDNLLPVNRDAEKKDYIAEKLTGGNLSMLQCSIGTPWEPDYTNKIVFIEEVEEAPYRIDRILHHLLQATNLSEAQAIVLGEFRKCSSALQSYELKSVLYNFAEYIKRPVYSTDLFGHGKSNIPLIYGADAIIAQGTSITLKVNRPVT